MFKHSNFKLFFVAALLTAGLTILSGCGKATAAPTLDALHVAGTNLVGTNNQPVVLHGMSTHGLQWFGQFANAGAFADLKKRGANVIRLAMYTDEGGYLSNAGLKEKVFSAADAALAQNLYVIIDWHILHDGNPRTHQQEAVNFFTEAARRFGSNPGVLYEICNEPNGNISWSNDVKPYALAVIPAIRASAPQSVILVGSTTWSQDVDIAAQDPLPFSNIMYTCHFYAGTHGKWLQDKIDAARSRGAAIFISEWGTSAADGNGGIFLDNAGQWLNFLAARNLSWCNWSLCDKAESSAALNPGADPNGGWTDSNLSSSGKFVFARF